jgi:EmrB/QacA subfamily drug resistance transporter
LKDEVAQREAEDNDADALDSVGELGGVEADAFTAGESMDAAIDARGRRTAARLGGMRFGSREGWLLAVCCVAQFMVILDLSIVNVALPSIQDSLSFTPAELQWVVDAYAITFAGFLMLGGRAADQLGQRRVFVSALILFSAASLTGGASVNKEMLIAARGVQGLSCAFMAASSLAIITSSFPPGPKLHRAIALWAAMNGAGGAAGTLFGGVITQELTWRWVLLINPPIGIAAALVGWRLVADVRRRRQGSFDLSGALTLTIGQMVLVYGVVEAGLRGWYDPLALGPMLGGFALLMLFNVIEVKLASEPLIPFKDFTRPLATANGIVILFSAALFPMWYLSSLYLQQVLGLSPLKAGLAFLPMAVAIMLVASRAGKLVSRFGVRAVLCSGLMMMTGGLLLFSKIAASGSPILYVVIPGCLTAAGIALSIVPSTILATQGVKQGQAGLASGVVNTSRQVGGGLGIAVLITLATSISSHAIGGNHAVPQALTDGFRVGYLIGAGLAAAAALVAFLFVERPAAELGPAIRRLPIVAGVAVVIGVFVVVDFTAGGRHGPPLGAYKRQGAYSFVSAPHLHPPIIQADVTPVHSSELAPGYIFLGSFYEVNYPPMVGQSGPLIIDNKLQPVWFKPVPQKDVASGLTRQIYNGKPALSWWQGVLTQTGETLSGEDVVVNQHYQRVATLRGQNGWVPTVHEVLIQGNNAWVTVNKNIAKNLAPYGGAYNGALIDAAVQEYNLKTGKLEYTWDALKHISLGDSQASLPTNGFPWDAYHVNSFQLLSGDRMLVSMRDTWAVYMVDLKTGKILWTLGGRHSTFKFDHGAFFSWQHDVRMYPGTSLMTIFDDHCCQETGGGTYVSPTASSRGLVLKLNQSTHTASLVSQYYHGSGAFDSQYMGSIEPLRGGDEFVGWGSEQNFTEFTSTGHQILDAFLPFPDISYRALVEPWVGLPLYPPSGAAKRSGGKTLVYASWNGATQVVAWRILGGRSASRLASVATVRRAGFETPIAAPPTDTTFRVQALGANGRVLGSSRLFTVKG